MVEPFQMAIAFGMVKIPVIIPVNLNMDPKENNLAIFNLFHEGTNCPVTYLWP
jgi:hypothetical protein